MFCTGQKILIAIVGALILLGVAKAVVRADAQADCLAQGYPDAKVDWKWNQYCVSYDFRAVIKK